MSEKNTSLLKNKPPLTNPQPLPYVFDGEKTDTSLVRKQALFTSFSFSTPSLINV